MAIKLFDKFIANNQLVQVEMHCLIAMTCLILAIKMQESCILDFEQASQLCKMESGFEYPIEMF